MSPSAVTVIIPTYNGSHLLQRCLQAVHRQDWRDFEVVVVDDGSTDGTVDTLSPLFPGVVWLRLERNAGFCRAVNHGAAHSRGRWLALLNNDAEPVPGWLSALMAAARRHPGVGIFASKMVALRNAKVLDDVGNAYTRSGRAFKVGYGEPDCGQYDVEREVFGACFGAALVQRELFAALGGLDERFCAYQEDVDFCFRARLAGHRCLYVPDAVVGHLGGGTSGGYASPRALRLSVRNAIWVIARNMPDPLLRRYWLRMLLDWGLYGAYITARGRGAPFLAGVREGLRQWAAMRRSGQGLRANTSYSATDLEQLLRSGEREVRRWRRRRRPAQLASISQGSR